MVSLLMFSRRFPTSTFHAFFQKQLHTSAPLCGLFPNMGGEQSYRQTDKMGPNYELIYRNPLPKSVQFVKHATNACLIVLPYFLYQRCQEFIDNMWMTSEVIFPSYDAVTSSEIFWLGFLLLSHAVAIKIHVDSMALRVYRDGNKFVTVYEGLLPFTKRKVDLKPGDVVEHFKAWNFCRSITYKVKGKNTIFFPNRFKRQMHLYEMLPNLNQYRSPLS